MRPPVTDTARLLRDGYTVLRGAIAPDRLDAMRAAFDANVQPSHAWPVPRGPGWRHAMVDLDPGVRAVCRLPALVRAAAVLIGERFFLAQVEGREPLAGDGHQGLHRDLSDQRPGDTVNALAFLDDYGPHNGATRLVPGTHRDPGTPPARDADEARAIQLQGRAGDILVFDADLLHAATHHPGDARRRSLLIGYFAASRHAAHLETARLRNVRMAALDWFDRDGRPEPATAPPVGTAARV